MINVKSSREDIIARAKADAEVRKKLKKNLLREGNKKPVINKDKKEKS